MNTKKELVEYVYDLHLQNNTEKIDFDRAFKYGIECAIDELEELNKLSLHNVSQQRELLKGFMIYVNSTDTTNHIYGHLLEGYLKTL